MGKMGNDCVYIRFQTRSTCWNMPLVPHLFIVLFLWYINICTHDSYILYYVYIDTWEVLVWEEDTTHSVHSRGSFSGLWAAARCDVFGPHAGDGSTPVTDGRSQCTETTSKMKHVLWHVFHLVCETHWAKLIISDEDSGLSFTKLLIMFPMVNRYFSYWKCIDVLLMLHMVMSIYKALFASVVWRICQPCSTVNFSCMKITYVDYYINSHWVWHVKLKWCYRIFLTWV